MGVLDEGDLISSHLKRLEIILKLTERCNIACAYCYYFENEEQSALLRPPTLRLVAAEQLAFRIREALIHKLCDSVRVIFHGGEPLLIGKENFRRICRLLVDSGAPGKIELCMQTNAILIDDEWIELFEEYKVAVGVSIDGPKDIHDRNRVDKHGNSTYEKTIKGIQRLILASHANRVSPPGALVVVQSDVNPRIVYNFLVYEVGLRNMDFLLPDATWENVGTINEMGQYLCELFDCWTSSDGTNNVDVRILKSTISLFLGGSSYLGGFGPVNSSALTVLSNGDINGDDFLRPCGDNVIDLKMNLSANSLSEAFNANQTRLTSLGAFDLPETCNGCAYGNICCGGQLTHRFSKSRNFNNSSVYCDSLKRFYEHVCLFLLKSGRDLKSLENILRRQRRAVSCEKRLNSYQLPFA